MNEYDWYSLDNAAKIFPAISNTRNTSVYRVDVRLFEPVDPVMLEEAVNTVLPTFPAFMVRMRHGLFWYYFEHNFEKALINEESAFPTSRIDPEANNGYLFKFSYYHKKISLDVFHALSDGTGAFHFLTAVTACYLRLCGKQLADFNDVSENRSKRTAMQDSFAHFFSSGQAEKIENIKAYHIKGTRTPKETVKVIHGILEADGVKALAKSRNVTVTVYLAALLAYAILETMPARGTAKPIRLFLPINLRRFFETGTQRNFFTFIYLDIEPLKHKYTFEALLQAVSGQMAERTKPEYFMPRLIYYVRQEKNILTRVMPLIIKNLALRVIHRQTGDKTHTITLSNLGIIDVPATVEEHIERFDVMTSNTRSNPLNCIVCTYKNQLVVTFTKSIFETDVEKFFFRFLSENGLKVILEQNQAGPE